MMENQGVILVGVLVLLFLLYTYNKNILVPVVVAVNAGNEVNAGNAPEYLYGGQNSGDYVFWPNRDWGGAQYDITRIPNAVDNVALLKSECNSRPACIGFNTGGWLKNAVSSGWQNFTSGHTGLYGKKTGVWLA